MFSPRSDRWKQYQRIWMSCTRGRWRRVTRITSSQVALMDFEEKYKYTDTKTSIRVLSTRLWQLWWWLFEICKISRIELSLTSYEFVVKSDSIWELQAPGTVGNEKNERQILELKQKGCFYQDQYRSYFRNTLLNLHYAIAFDNGTY